MRDDDDRIRDEFNPGASWYQREKAKKLLDEAGSNLSHFLEKRDLGADFRRAELKGRPLAGSTPILFGLTAHNPEDGHVVLSASPLPEISLAEICYSSPRGNQVLIGRLQASTPGRRAEDRRGDKVMISVARFFPG